MRCTNCGWVNPDGIQKCEKCETCLPESIQECSNGHHNQTIVSDMDIAYKKKERYIKCQDRLVRYGILILVFLIGLALPSPFFRNKIIVLVERESEPKEYMDTTNMPIDGGLYTGSIKKDTHKRDGYGKFVIKSGSPDETSFEGEWKNDKLRFGEKATRWYVYEGHFDAQLNMDGFGVAQYKDAYLELKSNQRICDSEIIATYIGNWSNNSKHGLGRAIMKDKSMEYGRFSEGILQKPTASNYKIGSRVYGIDASARWQPDIDWNNLALYCDKNGKVLNNPKPDEKVFMQPVFFVYLKATEGATVRDKMYSVRRTEAQRHRIVNGAYHLLSSLSSVDDQLKNFIEIAEWSPGDLPPALDVEWRADTIKKYGSELMRSMTLEWLEKAEVEMKVRPIIYTNQEILKNYLDDDRFENYEFWIARYSEKEPDCPDWQIWQKYDKGQISGCDSDIDINVYHDDYVSFEQYLKAIAGL